MTGKNLSAIVAVCAAVLAAPLSHGAGLKVDVGSAERSGTGAPGYVEWRLDPDNPSLTSGGLTVRLRAPGSVLEPGLYKSGLDYNARLACDGVSTRGGELAMVIAGLTAGPHTIATFHNSIQGANAPLIRFNLFVNNALVRSNLQPSIQVTNDYEVASAFVRVNAEAGKELVLKLVSVGSSGAAGMVLNGFEIDTGNPAARATKPSPADRDEHANGDDGRAQLTWTAAAGSVSHDIYVGTSADAVAGAD